MKRYGPKIGKGTGAAERPVLRAMLDTNVLVSLALAQRGPPLELRKAWQAGRFGVLVAPPLLDELRRVLERPKIATRLSRERRDGLLLASSA